MKYLLLTLGVWGALLTSIGSAAAQPTELPEPLLAQGFEHDQDAKTWVGIGDNAKVSTEQAPENVKEGTGSLRFDYQVAPGQNNVLLSALAPRSLATLESISFWIKANHNASFIFALQEQGGGRFGTTFSVVKDQWQRVEIAPEELVLQVDKDTPKDADGKLDVEKIEGVALLDFGQFLAQLAADPQNPIARILGIETGARTVYLDDVSFSSKPLPLEAPDKSLLDDFKHPQVGWMGIGGVTLKVAKDDAGKNPALQADYTQTANRVVAFAKLLPPGVLANKDSLAFDIATKRHATLIVQLEETSGGKYNTICDVAANETFTPRRLAFAAFTPADDSKDNNNRLDLDQVKQILIIDASGMMGLDGGDNTLWIHPIRVD